jgi:hypothetical protein
LVGYRHNPAALPQGKRSNAHCVGDWLPDSRFGRLRKTLTSPEFDPRAVHSVASRYTDCAIRALLLLDVQKQMLFSKRIPRDDIKVLNLARRQTRNYSVLFSIRLSAVVLKATAPLSLSCNWYLYGLRILELD